MQRRARGSAPKTHRGGHLLGPAAALVIVGNVGFVLGTMPDWLVSDPESPFTAEVTGLTVAFVTLVVISAVGGFRCIASTVDPVRTALAVIALILVLTVTFALGLVGFTEHWLTWLWPVGAVVGVSVIVGAVVGGLVSDNAASHR